MRYCRVCWAATGAPIVLGGLKRLEYRRYDSAGIAVLHQNGSIVVERAVGKLSNLRTGCTNILWWAILQSGTRWATHGGVTEFNALLMSG